MPGHPKHPQCPKCKKPLYKRMDPGSVRKTAPWAFCRNKDCERYGVNQAEGEGVKKPSAKAPPKAKAKPKPSAKTLKVKPPVKLTEPEQLQKARLRIREALAINGTYSKATIGLLLALVAQELGSKEFADRLIDEFDLSKTYGIEKQA